MPELFVSPLNPNDVTMPHLQAMPGILQDLPDLEQILTGFQRGNDAPFVQRVTMLPYLQPDINFFKDTWTLANNSGIPTMIVHHQVGISAEENRSALEPLQDEIQQVLGTNELPQILKTVSVAFPFEDGVNEGYKIALISGVGDFSLDKGFKKFIAETLGLQRNSGGSATINPRHLPTELLLGLQPGMIKPFIAPHLVHHVDAICILQSENPNGFVAISASPIDSMIIPVWLFEDSFDQYVRNYYKGWETVRNDNVKIYLP